jgi:GNAT superfamily N-acetyltransferase
VSSDRIRLREATAEDLPQVLALHAQPGMDQGEVISLARAEEIHASFSRYPNYRLFVANDTDRHLVGSYALLVMHKLGHQGTPCAIVEDVVVSAPNRGQGIGRQMMEHALCLAREAGCYKVALSSNLKRTRAHAFYESLGFERHGVSFLVQPEIAA